MCLHRRIILLPMLLCALTAGAQPHRGKAGSILTRYHIPELGYAVVTADSIIEIGTIGERRAGSGLQARREDRFHLGSVTKTITGFIAALLVHEGTMKWETKFFDLFPELRTDSSRAYADLTLLLLLTHRGGTLPCGIDDPFPERREYTGSMTENRNRFGRWILSHPPKKTNPLYRSNGGYILAAMMLERASGKSWEDLVGDLGRNLHLDFHFSYPNTEDSNQTWGHDEDLHPVPPGEHFEEMLLSSAGNINMSISDYARFVQLQLLGLAGRSSLLSREEFAFIHFSLPHYSIGWQWQIEKGKKVSFHIGSAGNFSSSVIVDPVAGRGYVVLTNASLEQSLDGMEDLMVALRAAPEGIGRRKRQR